MIWPRIKLLVTGKAEWCDAVTGAVIKTETMDWSSRWAIAGIHSCTWWWVQKYGQRDCGCAINPLTRRLVIIRSGCSRHSSLSDLSDTKAP